MKMIVEELIDALS